MQKLSNIAVVNENEARRMLSYSDPFARSKFGVATFAFWNKAPQWILELIWYKLKAIQLNIMMILTIRMEYSTIKSSLYTVRVFTSVNLYLTYMQVERCNESYTNFRCNKLKIIIQFKCDVCFVSKYWIYFHLYHFNALSVLHRNRVVHYMHILFNAVNFKNICNETNTNRINNI